MEPLPASPLPPAPPPPVIPAPSPPPTSPLSRIPKPVAITTLVALSLMVAVLAVSLIKSRSPTPRSTPPPSATSTPTPPTSPPSLSPTSSPSVSRLPLSAIAGHELITVVGKKLWLTEFTSQGPRKSLLLDFKYPISDLGLSPNRQLLAFTYFDPETPAPRFDVPPTGLSILDLRDKSLTELVGLSNLAIRYPTWSTDGLYLSVWNNGQSAILYDLTTKRRLLELTAPADSPISPIVFVPGQAKISYIQDGTLYESEYSGERRQEITPGVNAQRQVHEGPSLPDSHHYSPDASYIVFHNNLGQLILYHRSDTSRQILAEGAKSELLSAYSSFGDFVTFTARGDKLVYTDMRKDSYAYGLDDNPLYIFDLGSKSGSPFFPNRKAVTAPASSIPDLSRQHLVLHNQGFLVFSTAGQMESNCDYTNFRYNYYSWGGGIDYTTPLKVWSPDAKFILSVSTTQIADAFSCAVSGPFDSDSPSQAIWLK